MARNMTQGSITGHLLVYAVPLVFGNLFQQLYHTVDSVVVGQFNGKEALAAIGAAGPIMNILIFLIVGLSMGASIIMAEYFGAGDFPALKKEMATSIVSGLILTVIITVLAVAGSGLFIRLTQTPEEIAPLASDYLRIVTAGLIFTFFYNILSAGLRAIGDSKAPLYVLIITTVVNVVLDILLVGTFHMSVYGAAVATVIAQAVSSLLLFAYIAVRAKILWVPVRELRIDRDFLKKTIDFSSVSALQQTMLYLGRLLVQSGVNMLGVDAVAAFNAVSIVDSYVLAPGDSLASSMTTFAAQNKGAGTFGRISKGLKTMLCIAEIYVALVAVLVFSQCRLLLGFFPEAGGNCGDRSGDLLPDSHVLRIPSVRDYQYLPGIFQRDRKPENHPLGHPSADSHPCGPDLPAFRRHGCSGCGSRNHHRMDLHGPV